MELLLASDVVFAGRTARFGDQHGEFGLVPGWGGSQRLPRIVGLRRALDLFLTARWIDADEALAWGLVNYVVEDADLRKSALRYCHKLATRSRTGLAAMKQLARRGIDRSLNDGLALEVEIATEALVGCDVAEGLAAFQERRKPNFATAGNGLALKRPASE
jgi:enoyl-CoA hydratase